MWGFTVRSLREQLVSEGWHQSDARNYSMVIHPSGTLAIAVAAGDSFTSNPDRNPSTRTDKGPVTKDAIFQNQLTFADISDFPRPFEPIAIQTWLLLHHLSAESNKVTAELSLPAGMAEDGRVVAWRERIMLRQIALIPEELRFSTGDTEDVEIQVTRRIPGE